MRLQLVTGAVMPGPDPEVHALAAHLRARGHDASVEVWTGDGGEGDGGWGDGGWGDGGWGDADLVVIRSPWDYVGARDQFVAWAERVQAVTSLANPAEVVASNSHKSYLLDLAQAGLAVPAVSLVEAGASRDGQRRALGRHAGPVVIKPAVGGGARGAVLVEAGEDPSEVLSAAVATGDTLVQDYCPGIAEGEVSLVYLGGELSHAVRKVPVRGEFRSNAHHGGSLEPHRPAAEEVALARRALAASPGPLLYARVDLVTTPSGPALMEVELVEPDLYLRTAPGSMDRMAEAMEAWQPLRR